MIYFTSMVLFCVLGHLGSAEHMSVDLDAYPGGVAVWYLLPEVWTTKTIPGTTDIEYADDEVYAIHVHAREVENGPKLIDGSFTDISILSTKLNQPLHITTDFAQKHFMSSINRENEMDSGLLHSLDYLNTQYNRNFDDAQESVHLSRYRCPGGFRIFSFNRALLWTSPLAEERGIHVHCYDGQGEVIVDGSFSEVHFLADGENATIRVLTVDNVRECAVQKELHRCGLAAESECKLI